MIRRLSFFALVVCLAACGSKSPTAPTTPPAAATPTRIIALSGAMAFGNIQVGSSFTATINVQNLGNAVMTVTGLTGTNGIIAVTSASPTSFSVSPGGSQNVTIRFAPTAAVTYTGNIGFSADQTSGTPSIAFSGTGSLDGLPVFVQTGNSDSVFTMPSYVTTVRVSGTYTANASNFIIFIGPAGSACDVTFQSGCRLLVNELLGTGFGKTNYTGTLQTGGGGLVQVVKSSGVNWSVTEVR